MKQGKGWAIVAGAFLAVAFLLPLGAQGADVKGYDVEIILDSSGSMAEKLSGKSKMDIAKEAIREVVNGAPDGSYMGFRAYGHQSGTAEKNCTDSQLVVSIGALNKSDFISRVNALTPRGWTPIDYSLRQAKNDFSDKSEYGKMIILVSDGEETCGGNPCQAVKDMKAAGFNVVVNTVGFSVGSVAREQLKCIAAATGGEYKDANSASELTESMRVFSKRAFQGYTPSGTVVAGTGFGNAPLVTPGIYGGDLLTDESKFYKFNVKKGQKISVSVSIKKEKPMVDAFSSECVCMVTTLTAYGSDMSELGEKKANIYEYTGAWKGLNNPEDSSQYCIKASEISPKAYNLSYDVPNGGENYVSVSMGWKEACQIGVYSGSNDKSNREAEEAKKNFKAFYDVKITVEGAGSGDATGGSASGGKTGTDSSLNSGDDAGTVPADDFEDLDGEASSSKWVIWIILAALILVGGVVVFIIILAKKKDSSSNYVSGSGITFNGAGPASSGEEMLGNNSQMNSIQAGAPMSPFGANAQSGQAGMKACPQCGKQNLPEAKFCSGCGKQL